MFVQGRSVRKCEAELDVHRNKAFRWRHRSLSLPRERKAQALAGIEEADETYMRPFKGQPRALRRHKQLARHARQSSHARRHLRPRAAPATAESPGQSSDLVLAATMKAQFVRRCNCRWPRTWGCAPTPATRWLRSPGNSTLSTGEERSARPAPWRSPVLSAKRQRLSTDRTRSGAGDVMTWTRSACRTGCECSRARSQCAAREVAQAFPSLAVGA